jgi:hypothetical protein
VIIKFPADGAFFSKSSDAAFASANRLMQHLLQQIV